MIPEATDINTDPGYVKVTDPDMVLNYSPGLDPTIVPCDTTGHLDHINFLIMDTITYVIQYSSSVSFNSI